MGMIDVDQVLETDPRGARLPHDEKYEKGVAFANGEYSARDEAVIPLMDLGFQQCDVTYDKTVVLHGRFFRLQDYFARFARSCEKFRLRNPYSEDEMVRIFSRMIRMTGLRDASVFWCVTRGLAKGITDGPDAFENRFYAIVDTYKSITTAQQRSGGLNLIVSKKYIRIPPRAVDPTAKNFHWQDMKLSLFEAMDRGKDWAVLTDGDGYLTEAVGANVFAIKNGELYTPDSGCLEGITRQTTLELAEMIGVRTHVEKVHATQLLEADDAFITSSSGGIMPVNSVDGVVLGGVEGPGRLSARLHDLYWEKVWSGWKGTPVNYES